MSEPKMTLQEAQKSVEMHAQAPRVTEASIRDKIDHVEYLTPVANPNMTIAVLTTTNGFSVVGVSAPASAANFDPEVGKRYAFENAFKQLWQLEGYLLRDRLSRHEGV